MCDLITCDSREEYAEWELVVMSSDVRNYVSLCKGCHDQVNNRVLATGTTETIPTWVFVRLLHAPTDFVPWEPVE